MKPFVIHKQFDFSDEEISSFKEALIATLSEKRSEIERDLIIRRRHILGIRGYDYSSPANHAFNSPVLDDEMREILNWHFNNDEAAGLLSIPLTLVDNLDRFPFISQVFEGIPIEMVRILIISSWGRVMPHADIGARKMVINFPIDNCWDSETGFFILNREITHRILYRDDEVERIATLKYEPKTSYILNTALPHDVVVTSGGERIMLSCGIFGNPNFSDIQAHLTS